MLSIDGNLGIHGLSVDKYISCLSNKFNLKRLFLYLSVLKFYFCLSVVVCINNSLVVATHPTLLGLATHYRES